MRLVFVLTAWCMIGVAALGEESPATDPQKMLRQLLEQAHARSGLPALGAAVVLDGKLMAYGAVGFRNVATQAPVSDDDPFHIGSCAKAMTATVIAKLVDEGKLGWDSTIAIVFPQAKPQMHRGYWEVTVEQLLAHRGGLPRNPPGLIPPQIAALPGRTLREQRLSFLNIVLKPAPLYPPGTRFDYSNVGYTVVGAMAEQAVQASWEELVQTRMLQPLGMSHSHFGNVPANQLNHHPWGHVSQGGRLTPVRPGRNPNDPPQMSPAGSVLHCSMRDLGLFLESHVAAADKPQALLRPATLKRLHTPLAGSDYAGGWGVIDQGGGVELFHTGANPMNCCSLYVAVDCRLAVAVASNCGPDRALQPCSDLTNELVEVFYNGEQPQESDQNPQPSSRQQPNRRSK